MKYGNIGILVALWGGCCLLAACGDDRIGQAGPEDGHLEMVEEIVAGEIAPGTIRVNFKRTPEVEKALKSLHSGPGRKMGLMSVDRAIGGIPGARLERVIPYTKRFEKGDREWGFDMWYRLRFDEEMSVEDVRKIVAQLPEVEMVYPEYLKPAPVAEYEDLPLGPVGFATRASGSLPFTDPMLSTQWNYGKGGVKVTDGSDIGVFKVWKRGIGGDPRVIVAVIDGGIQYDHPDLEANMWHNPGETFNGTDDDGNGYVDDVYGYNFYNGVGGIGPLQPEGHGTHVAGTVAAVNNNGVGVCGVAGGTGKGDGVRLMSCQIHNGQILRNEPEAFIYAARNGAVIAQCSWGGYVYEPDLEKAVQFFTDSAGTYDANSLMKGGLVICAAGNDDRKDRTYPASLEQTIAVASTNSQRRRSSFSNYGDWIDLSAPGGELGSADYQIPSTWIAPTYYKTEKGTSMACPHVSGIAALVVSEMGGPDFTNKQLKEILLSSVADLTTTESFYSGMLGRGLIRADLALKCDDQEAPAQVTDVKLVKGEGEEVRLEWNHVADPNDEMAAKYRVYISTTPMESGKAGTGEMLELPVGNVPVGAKMSYTLSVPADHNAVLYYAVTAVDVWGNESLVMNPVKLHWSSVFIGAGELRIYPLPLIDELTVEWGEEFTGEVVISIYDLSGRRVYLQKVDREDSAAKAILQLQNLAFGNYILEVKSEGKTQRRPIIKV